MDTISVIQFWVEPKECEGIVITGQDVPLSDLYPDGIFVRLTESGAVLSAVNATREEAEQMLWF